MAKKSRAKVRSSSVKSFTDTRGRRRWSLFLGPGDHEAIGCIQAAHGHDKASEAVRFAIHQQAARSKGSPNGQRPVDSDAERSRWSLFLGPKDHKAIDDIRRAGGFDKMSEAVRFAIHAQAKRDRKAMKV